MDVLGSIQSDNVALPEREKVQRLMRDFIGGLRQEQGWDNASLSYRIHFWRPFFGSKIDALLEFRIGEKDAWFARANGASPWKAFCRALASMKQIITEMDLREDGVNAKHSGGGSGKN